MEPRRTPTFTHDEIRTKQREAHELRLEIAKVQSELDELHGRRMHLAARYAELTRQLNERHP